MLEVEKKRKKGKIMLLKKLLTLSVLSFLFLSCEMTNTLGMNEQNPEFTPPVIPGCLSNLECSSGEFCDLSTSLCSTDISSFVNGIKASINKNFENVMFGYGYSFGYKDGSEHLFQASDISVFVENVDLVEAKADFELSISPLIAGNVKKGDSFMVNPLFIINIASKNECLNGEKILLKEIYTLSSEIFPIELIEHYTHDTDFSVVYTPSLVFSKNKANLKDLCQEKNGLKASRATFACSVVKEATTVKTIGANSYGIINKALNLNMTLETHGKNTVAKFNSDYAMCLEDLIMTSEYKEERSTDNMAVFKVRGVYYK